MEAEEPCDFRNEENSLIEEDELEKLTKGENGELPTEITENVLLETEKVRNELLFDIEKSNLGIDEVNVLQFILRNFDLLKNDNNSENQGEFKKKKNKKSAEKNNLSVTECVAKLKLSTTQDDKSFAKAIELRQVISENKEETMTEPKSDKTPLNELEEIENCHNTQVVAKPKKACRSHLDKLRDDIGDMLMDEKIMSTDNKHICTTEERVQGDLNEAKVELYTRIPKMVGRSDFAKMLIKDEELPLLVLKKVVYVSPADNSSHKKIGKRKNMCTSSIIQKKVRKGDWSSKIDETQSEKDDEEFELNDYVEHDKNYFFVDLVEICCKLCNFKGKLIVQHYRMSHPESEVLISRLNPHITEILIEDAIRNGEEYDKDHPELEKIMCNFKCPFCLMTIKDTTNTYYNHISSHTGEYCFHCNHCSYWTYNHMNIHSHLNQMHFKIEKAGYKMVFLNPQVLKYIFGYICSECNFIQLIRTTVEEHAMVYHPGVTKIHKVNLGVLLHDYVLDEIRTNEIHLNKNMSSAGEASLNGRATEELNDCLVQKEELETLKVKTESQKLGSDLCPIKLTVFVCETTLDIEQCTKADRTEMLQWTNENVRTVNTPISDQLQIDLATEVVKESEKFPRENKEPKSMSEEMEKLIEEVGPSEQPEKAKEYAKILEIGPICVIKEFNVFTFHCKIQNCNYSSKDKTAFAIHCEIIHKDYSYNFGTGECNICSIKFKYKGKFVTVFDVYLHVITMHKDFFEPKSAINFKLMDDVLNVLSPTYDNLKSEFPFTISNLTSKSDMNSVSSLLPLIPLAMEDEEEALSPEVKLPVIVSVQSLTTKTKQLISASEDDSKCASVLTDILMTDTEKQNRKCPKAIAVMMKPPLLTALYKCPKYDCSFATTLSSSFQKHFTTQHSILMDTLVPCLYCDYKVLCSSYVTHLEVRHGHCLFGCGDCFYRTTNSYFITMHRELMHPNTEFNILQLEVVTSSIITADITPANLSELMLPYNCKEDGFLSCSFKTLYFEEYLKHVEAIHQVNELSSFSSEKEPQKEAVIEGWLAKEVGPFQCRYCKKATVTHEEMGRHQAVFHTQEQCLFYYRKFVPFKTVMIPEQVNLEDPSFINHIIHLPDQIHLCNFKLTDGLLSSTSAKLTNGKSEGSLPLLPPTINTEIDSDQSSVSLDEPKAFSPLVNDEECLREDPDSLCLDEQPKDGSTHSDAMETACKLQCKWKGCNKSYDSQTALVKHIKQNHIRLQRGDDFTCSWINCPRNSKPFSIKQNLLEHMRIHTKEKPYKCSFQGCNKAFSQLGSLNKHQRRHTGERPYMCRFSDCFKSFSHISNRNRHQRTHYNTESYACQVTGCSKEYIDERNLQKHMKDHSIDEQAKAEQKSVENKQKQDDFVLKKSFLQCEWKGCYQTCHSQTALVKHIEKNHVQLQTGEGFTCFWNSCLRKSKPFNTKQTLLRHISVHSGEKPYKCGFEGCNKAFSHPGDQKVHQRRHAGERPYLCKFSNCFKSFITSYDRNNHQRTHYDPEAYTCQVTGCSKKYGDPKNLWAHMKRHTVDEQLEAKQKSIEKDQKPNDLVLEKCLNSSDRTKHQSMQCDTLQCKWKGCCQTYNSQTVLVKHIEKNHVQLQKGWKFTCFWISCSRKSKPFTTKQNLSVHMRVHSGEKPYKCPFQKCNKAFSEMGHLKNHQRRHTGKRPHLCQFSKCFQSFSTSYDRDYHQMLHHDAEGDTCQVTSCSKKFADLSSNQKHIENHTVNKELDVKQKSVENEQKENDFIIYDL